MPTGSDLALMAVFGVFLTIATHVGLISARRLVRRFNDLWGWISGG